MPRYGLNIAKGGVNQQIIIIIIYFYIYWEFNNYIMYVNVYMGIDK